MRTVFHGSGGTFPACVVALNLLSGCGESAAPDDATNAVLESPVARVVPASEAISGAHVPTLDPMTMVDAEILQVLEPGPRCEFRYTSASPPVLAVQGVGDDTADGVVKVNGKLVALSRTSTDGGLALSADPIRLRLTAERAASPGATGRRDADLLFEIGEALEAGYRGYYECVE